MSKKLQYVYKWMYGVLTNDSELQDFGSNGVFGGSSAVEDTPFPYFVFQKQTGSHQYVMGKEAIQVHYVMLKSVDKSFDGGKRGRLMMGRAADLLNNQQPEIEEGYVLNISANNDFEYDEQESGNLNFYHCGIVFKIEIGS